MRKIVYSLTLILATGLVFIMITGQKPPDQRKFYYAYHEKIFIDEIPDKFVVKYKDKVTANRHKSILIAELKDEKKIQYQNETTITVDIKNGTKNIQQLFVDKMMDVVLIKPAYLYKEQEMYYANEIIVEPNDGVTIYDVLKKNGLDTITKVREEQFYSVIEIDAAYDACEVANKIQESGLAKYSHPNFMMPIEVHQVIPNDTYFNNQFYLRNTGQVFNPVENHAGTPGADIKASWAWTITTGNSNIIVAVLDQGVTPDHPDLPNARQVRLNGSNFSPGENANDPTPGLDNNHGNACAEIIAATQNNNEGISGIAPNIRIMPIKIFDNSGIGVSNSSVAAAIDFAWQNGADVISNSWGYKGVAQPNYIPAIVASINRAVTQGRGNLGCVVVFSAGNEAKRSYSGYNGFVIFPATVQINGVLTVGASDRDDKQADFSPTSMPADAYNQIIDIVAPSNKAAPLVPGLSFGILGEGSEVWTIDIPGTNGYNQWNYPLPTISPAYGEILPATGVNNLSYTGRMSGTSASCPQVAAVAALMLSVNPTLTQQEVFNKITQSADHVGGYTYTNGWSAELGNGRLNACAAVVQSLPLSISGLDTVCVPSSTYSVTTLGASSYSWSVDNSSLATIIPNGNSATISQSGSLSGNLTITVLISWSCGTRTITKNIWVGPRIPFVHGWYNSPTNAAEPMRPSSNRFDFNWNDACFGQYINTDILFSTGATIMWEDAGNSGGITWWQSGNNISFYFSDIDQYAYFRVRATNFCGTTSVLYRFRSITCSGGGMLMLSVNPNPSTGNAKVTISEKSKPDQAKNIQQIRIIDKTGILKKEYHFGLGEKNPTISTFGLSPDIYTIIAFDGLKWVAAKWVVQ